MAKDLHVIVKQLYPKVDKAMNSNTLMKFKKLIENFIDKRHESLFDFAPCDRISYTENDADEFFQMIGITRKEVRDILSNVYYWSITSFNPRAAKDELTVLVLTLLRYFYIKRMNKELELCLIYLSFSGKFYPSIHYGSYPNVQPSENRYIMDYVVNNELSNKYDIKKHGSVINSVKSIGLTWINSYGNRLREFDDEDIVYLIQQLHNRIKSFTINIADVYYRIYANKEKYMTYDSDNLNEDSYRLADSDSLRIERYVEASMNNIISKSVDPRICRISASNNIRIDELRSILETIIEDNVNISEVKELIRILVTEYFNNSKDKDPSNISFISTSIASKPNTKNPNIHRQNEILEKWLDVNSPNYRRRKSRLATKLSYHKAVLSYFVLIIHQSSKGIR